MSDSLEALRRQHALVRSHLAWLEAEIARAEGTASSPTPAVTPTSTLTSSHPPSPEPAPAPAPADSATVDTDALLARYGTDSAQSPTALRRGCLIVFCGALGLLITAVVVIYFLRYR
jgi:hypothetical protein